MSKKSKIIHNITIGLIVLWTFIITVMVTVNIYQNYEYANNLALTEARVSVQKDLAYRVWVASHGGVYVPITKKTPPNPYLSHIKNRDVSTNDGQHLTLMNPAYTLSQMMHDYAKLYGIKGHITSLTLLNPKNMPDSWERKNLHIIEKTRKPVFETVTMNNKKYLRYLNPLVTRKSCLKCHAFQGYKVGDIRGGVSVSVALEPYDKGAFNHSLFTFTTFLIIYIIGIFVILYAKEKAVLAVEEKIKDYEQNIYTLVHLIEQRDSYTAGHSKRVAKYAVLIAKAMGVSNNQIEELREACMLHDIGKISTPDSVLLKPEHLDDLEYEIIKEHVVVSYEILKEIDIYKDIAEIIKYHHERYDGKGYPYGIKGNEIPLLSQIITVADAFDAMTTDRIYKVKKSVSEALAELQKYSGTQFNPKIVSVASVALKDVEIDKNISQLPMTKREEERFAYFFKDRVTDAYNHEYLASVLLQEDRYKYICGIFLHNFTQYNQKNGWEEGDKLLAKVSRAIKNIPTEVFLLFRVYGDDFMLLTNKKLDNENIISQLKRVLDETGISVSSNCLDIKEKNIKTLADVRDAF